MRKREIILSIGILLFVCIVYEINSGNRSIFGLVLNTIKINPVNIFESKTVLKATVFDLNSYDIGVNQILDPEIIPTEKPSLVKPYYLIGILLIIAILLVFVTYRGITFIIKSNSIGISQQENQKNSNQENKLDSPRSLSLQPIINESTSLVSKIKDILENKYLRKLKLEQGIIQIKLMQRSLRNWVTTKTNVFINGTIFLDLTELLRGTNLLNSYG